MQCYESLALRLELRRHTKTLFPHIEPEPLALDAALCDFGVRGLREFQGLESRQRQRLVWHACELSQDQSLHRSEAA